jgi:hypothetical protein
LIRLAGALLSEQRRVLVQRRSLSVESMALINATDPAQPVEPQDLPSLAA